MYKTWKHCFRHIGPLSDLIWRSLRRRSLYEEEDREDRNRHRWIILYVTYLSLSVSIYLSLSVYISPVQNFKYKVQAQNEVLVSQYFLYIIDIYSLAINHLTFLEFGEINNILISIYGLFWKSVRPKNLYDEEEGNMHKEIVFSCWLSLFLSNLSCCLYVSLLVFAMAMINLI